MTKEEALQELREMNGNHQRRDTELDHIRADEILCDLLMTQGGFDEVVEAYNAIHKWHA